MARLLLLVSLAVTACSGTLSANDGAVPGDGFGPEAALPDRLVLYP